MPSRPPFKQHSNPLKRTQGFRKSNKPKTGYFNARVTSIEEVDEEEMDEDKDIPFLAARTARLSKEQQESLLEEIQDINTQYIKNYTSHCTPTLILSILPLPLKLPLKQQTRLHAHGGRQYHESITTMEQCLVRPKHNTSQQDDHGITQ